MRAISIKYLCDQLPLIQSELKKGEIFLIIYKNKPIAKLISADSSIEPHEDDETDDKEWENAAVEDLNKSLEKDYLTQEEIDYYMSLPDIK